MSRVVHALVSTTIVLAVSSTIAWAQAPKAGVVTTLEGTVTGPVTDPYGNERYGLSLTTVVDRTAFGLDWNAPLPGGGFALANDVTLKAELSLVKAA